MTRTEVLSAILDFMGPLGPFQDQDERDSREEAWAAGTGAGALEQIFDLLRRPPTADELGRITPEDFEYELSRILTVIGGRAPSPFIARVGPLLKDPSARTTIIEVLGSLRLEESLFWLEPLIEDRTLAEEEAVRLACALGEIGGSAVPPLLDRLASATPPERRRVHEEIGIAREASR